MKTIIKDGWHIVYGYRVYVENGCVLRGTKMDINGYDVPAYPYESDRKGGYDNCSGVNFYTFRKGVKENRMFLF